MFRFILFLILVFLGWMIVNGILKRIIRSFGGGRPQGNQGGNTGFGRNSPHDGTNQEFDDIKDAEYTDITDTKK